MRGFQAQVLLGTRIPASLKKRLSNYCRIYGIKINYFITEAIKERLLNPTTLDFARFDVHRGAVIPTKFLKKKEVNSIYREFYQRLYSPDFLSYLKHRQPAVFKVAQKILQSTSISTLLK